MEAMPGSLEKIIVVTNPTPESELGDIMFEATPEELYLIAKGTVEDPRTLKITFYSPENREAALHDANTRLEFIR